MVWEFRLVSRSLCQLTTRWSSLSSARHCRYMKPGKPQLLYNVTNLWHFVGGHQLEQIKDNCVFTVPFLLHYPQGPSHWLWGERGTWQRPASENTIIITVCLVWDKSTTCYNFPYLVIIQQKRALGLEEPSCCPLNKVTYHSCCQLRWGTFGVADNVL